MRVPPRRIPPGGRRCGICGKDLSQKRDGAGGYRTAMAMLAEAGVPMAIPNHMHAHPSCVRRAQEQLKDRTT